MKLFIGKNCLKINYRISNKNIIDDFTQKEKKEKYLKKNTYKINHF